MSLNPEGVTPQQIIMQREAGWPDFHPEKFCHLCGRRNLRSWYVESSLWNAAHVEDEQERRGFRRSGIVCPQCFEQLLEAAGGGHCTWELRPDAATLRHLTVNLEDAEQIALAKVYETIDEARREVMKLYGGNLDHPALDDLEAAMSELVQTDEALQRARSESPEKGPPRMSLSETRKLGHYGQAH